MLTTPITPLKNVQASAAEVGETVHRATVAQVHLSTGPDIMFRVNQTLHILTKTPSPL